MMLANYQLNLRKYSLDRRRAGRNSKNALKQTSKGLEIFLATNVKVKD